MKFASAHLLTGICLLAAACSEGEDSTCAGFLLSAPKAENAGPGSFSVAQLMAHSAAMGMTQQEAETLLYLEGIFPSHTLAPGETLCVDGKPQ